jgi:hypothetical protein
MAEAAAFVQERLDRAAGVGVAGLDRQALHAAYRAAQNEPMAFASLSKISKTRCRETIDSTL